VVTEYLDRRVEPARRLSRFLIFALAAILAISALTARLFYLQVVNGVEYSALAEQNRTALESVPAPRGLIFDRKGRPLVTNAAMYSVKVRAADIPEDRRDEVVDRLAALLNKDVTEINTAIDSNPGSRFDLVRVAENVNEAIDGIIALSRPDMHGVEVLERSELRVLTGDLKRHPTVETVREIHRQTSSHGRRRRPRAVQFSWIDDSRRLRPEAAGMSFDQHSDAGCGGRWRLGERRRGAQHRRHHRARDPADVPYHLIS